MYPADGRKIPDVYTAPAPLRDQLQSQLGTFPLFEFWGPRAGIRSTRWIADAAMLLDRQVNPTLSLIYLPHLDYNLQRLGAGAEAADDLRQVDAICADLIRHYESAGARVIATDASARMGAPSARWGATTPAWTSAWPCCRRPSRRPAGR